jgi:hypothetical protein
VHSKNNENTRFSAESRQTTFHTHVLTRYLLTLNAKYTFKSIDFASIFIDFSIGFWNCSGSVVFFVFFILLLNNKNTIII